MDGAIAIVSAADLAGRAFSFIGVSVADASRHVLGVELKCVVELSLKQWQKRLNMARRVWKPLCKNLETTEGVSIHLTHT